MSKSNSIDPSLAAELALGIYGIRDPRTVSIFLSSSTIVNTLSDEFQVLSARVGGRMINSHADNFGLIVKVKWTIAAGAVSVVLVAAHFDIFEYSFLYRFSS